MSIDLLNEREFELVNIVGAQLGSNQRDLSRHMDLSLGSINMLPRRLIAKGYIRTKQLNNRKVKYLLTPKGFAEKMRKSVNYTCKTLSSIGLIKEKIKDVLIGLHGKGERSLIIFGKSDLALLVEIVSRELNLIDLTIIYTDEVPQDGTAGILMVCKEDVVIPRQETIKSVDLIHELAKDSCFINQMGSVT